MSSSGSTRLKPSNDLGWDYGQPLLNDKNSVKCDLCQVITKGGINRHKQHLAGGYPDVKVCSKVTKDIQEKIRNYIAEQKLKKEERERIKRASIAGVNIFEGVSSTGNDEEVEALESCRLSSSGGTTSNLAPKGPKQKGPLDSMFPPNFDKLVQKPLDNVHGERARNNTCDYIADFFYENGLSFNVAKSSSFTRMLAAVGQFGEGLKPPSYHELRVTILQKKVQAMKEWIDSFKVHWKIYGCSLMTDWWTDGRGRTLINFLVNCPKGTVFLKSMDGSEYVKDAKLILDMLKEVIEEVGEDNVVQVITDNASNYKLAGKWLMEDKNLFWTPCAAHCVNLICQEIAAHPKVDAVVKECRTISVFMYNHTNVLHMMRRFTGNRDLLRPAVTRFATSFLSMESIFNQKAGLRTMIHSEDWTKSKWVTTADGKRVAKIIKKSSFWNRLHFALKVLAPLVDVIRLVDMEEKPCMGYIYHAMEDCKKKITANLGESDNGFLNEVLMIVDRRWVDQLHQPLHAAGYYLNPSIYFINQGERDSDLESNSAIKRGLFDAIKKLVSDVDKRDKIIDQLSVYRTARGMMGDPIAVRKRATSAPVEWWITWGSEVPELQDFAKRVLGLTCAASPCERNWSSFNNLHSKKRNMLEHQKLNDLVFVQYNTKLKARYLDRTSLAGRDTDPIVLKDMEECDEWLVPYDAANDRVGDTDLTYGLVEEAEGNEEHGPRTSTRTYKRRRTQQQQQQQQSQRRGKGIQSVDQDSEYEDDEETSNEEGKSSDDGPQSAAEEDLDF